MAKLVYCGNSGVSKKVGKIYIGSGNTSHKVKKGYIGVNNTSKIFFGEAFLWKKYNCTTTTVYIYNRYTVTTSYVWDYEQTSHSPPGRMTTSQRTWYRVSTAGIINPSTGTWSTRGTYSLGSSSASPGWIGASRNPSTIYDCSSNSQQPSGGYLFLYYLSRTAVRESGGSSQGSYIDQITVSSKIYPDNGQSGSYWYVYQGSDIQYSQGSYISDVSAETSNAYPSNGRHTDGYWYVYQGPA